MSDLIALSMNSLMRRCGGFCVPLAEPFETNVQFGMHNIFPPRQPVLSWTYRERAAWSFAPSVGAKWPGQKVWVFLSKAHTKTEFCGKTCELTCRGRRCRAIEPVSYGAS